MKGLVRIGHIRDPINEGSLRVECVPSTLPTRTILSLIQRGLKEDGKDLFNVAKGG